MARSAFGERFGYALWLYHLRAGRAPTFRAIGEAVKRSGEAVAAWLKMENAPDKASLREPLPKHLHVPEDWLFEGEGEAPRADLWHAWIEERHKGASALPSLKLTKARSDTPKPKTTKRRRLGNDVDRS